MPQIRKRLYRPFLVLIIRTFDFLHKPLRAHMILFFGVLILLLGMAGMIPGPVPYLPIAWLPNFHRDISPELVGIGIAVLIVDWAIAQRESNREKRELTSQLGNPNNESAKEAARILNIRRWLIDGTLRHAYLLEANLQGAHLFNADLKGARMWQANLQMADLESANLQQALLWQANLQEANLDGADLQDTHLVGANLQGASLRNADLRKANLSRANLRNANLGNANLQGSIYTTSTLWPLNYDPVSFGANLVDDAIGDVLFVTGTYIGQKVTLRSRLPKPKTSSVLVEKATLIFSHVQIRAKPEKRNANKSRYLVYARRMLAGEELA